MNNVGIYILEWENNNNYYLGQSRNLIKRGKRHLYKLRTKTHENSKLQNIFNRYGECNFKVVELLDVKDLDKKEQHYLDLYFTDKYCCNLTNNIISFKGSIHTEETKKLIGIKSKLKVFSEEYRKKLSEAQLNRTDIQGGYKHTEESKIKMSKSRKGIKLELIV